MRGAILAASGIACGCVGTAPAPTPVPPFSPDELAEARSLAERELDRARGSESVRRQNLIWAESHPAPPPPGAEVVLIAGYISHTLRVLEWDGTVVHGTALAMGKPWFYGPPEETFGASWFAFEPREFRVRWAAVQLVTGARIEWRPDGAPDPNDRTFSGRAYPSSHTPDRWLRIDRGQGGGLLVQVEVRRSRQTVLRNSSHFPEAQARAAEAIFESPLVARQRAAEGGDLPLAAWQPFLRRELAALAASELDRKEDARWLLLSVCLRGIGAAGEAKDLPLVERIRERIGPLEPPWEERGALHRKYAIEEGNLSVRNLRDK